MNRILWVCIAMPGLIGLAGPAYAGPRLSPANTNFTVAGGLLPSCTFTINAKTGPALPTPPLPAGSSSGTILGGVGSGPGVCPLTTIDPTTFTITSATTTSASGTIPNLTVRLNGMLICSGPLQFALINNGSLPSKITATGSLLPNCSVNADLPVTSSPDIDAYP